MAVCPASVHIFLPNSTIYAIMVILIIIIRKSLLIPDLFAKLSKRLNISLILYMANNITPTAAVIVSNNAISGFCCFIIIIRIVAIIQKLTTLKISILSPII